MLAPIGQRNYSFKIRQHYLCFSLPRVARVVFLTLVSAVAGLKLLGGPNLHFYCSTLVFNIYFLEFAKLLGGPGPPRPLPTLRHCLYYQDSDIVCLLLSNMHFFAMLLLRIWCSDIFPN